MEFTGLLNTSLDLNAKPLRILDDHPIRPKQEVGSSLFKLGRDTTVKDESRSCPRMIRCCRSWSVRVVASTELMESMRDAVIEELNRVTAENKRLTELLTVMCENCTELRNQLMECTTKNFGLDNNNNTAASKKRKAEGSINNVGINNIDEKNKSTGASESSSSDEDSSKKRREEPFKPKISRTSVRAEISDASLIVKDGYQWRKYGQKVTRDNPSPRAYFKCSFAPTCPVKKKVQRSIEDQSVVVATYEGEHNHPQPSKLETNSGSNKGMALGTAPSSSSSGPTITLDLTKSKPSHEETRNFRGKVDAPELQHYFVEQMASTLTKDPNFKAALAAAITGKFLRQNEKM